MHPKQSTRPCPTESILTNEVPAQRLWERLINYTMGQLVVLGAVVEPDLAEFLLWLTFAAFVGFLGLCSGESNHASESPLLRLTLLSSLPGLCRDRLDYLAHLPELPSSWVYFRLLFFLCTILVICILIVSCGMRLLWEAGLSTLILFMFQVAIHLFT